MKWCHIIWFLTSFFHFALSQRSVFNLETLYTELRPYWVYYSQFYRCWKIPVRVKNGWGVEATFGNLKASGVQPFSSIFLSLLLPVVYVMNYRMTTLSFPSGWVLWVSDLLQVVQNMICPLDWTTFLRLSYHCVASPWFMHLCVINWTLEFGHSFNFVLFP